MLGTQECASHSLVPGFLSPPTQDIHNRDLLSLWHREPLLTNSPLVGGERFRIVLMKDYDFSRLRA